MIFNGEEVTKLVVEWQRTKDSATMDAIVYRSMNLIEAIVSSYDSSLRDDLIQESVLKLQYACQFFKPAVSSLHNFFTTVIHNVCRTYVVKQNREFLLDDKIIGNDHGDVYELELPDHTDTYKVDCAALDELLVHMRKRFLSIPVSVVDDCTDIIYYGLAGGDNYKTIITSLNRHTQSRAISQIMYNACVIYLRAHNMSCASVDIDDIAELSLLNELRMILGDTNFSRVLVAFSGMTIRIPQ